MAADSPYVVLLAKPEGCDPLALAKALAAVRKTPLQDQIGVAKSAWGIVAENLGEADAVALAEALGASGIDCMRCPAASLSPLPEAEPAKTWQALPLTPPAFIMAAALPITTTTTKTIKEGPSGAQKMLNTAILLGTGLPIKLGGKERTVEKTQQNTDRVYYLDLLYADPLRRLRVEAEHFDYSFLKERKLFQVLGNFKLLISDLAQSAPAAWKNHGARVLLEGKPMMTMGYESLADLEKECRWLLTIQTLMK